MPVNTRFTPEEKDLLARVAHAVWTGLAYDCLQCLAESSGKPIERVRLRRSEAIEAALDAGRLEEVLARRRDVAPDLVARVRQASYQGS